MPPETHPIVAVERRAFVGVELRQTAEGKPEIVGYAATFNSLSQPMGFNRFRERIAPGAFAKCLAGGPDVRALVNHDANMILGRTKAATLVCAEDERGLRCVIQPPDTGPGRDVMESVRRGDLDGMSFAFRAVSETWDETEGQPPVRTLNEVELFDVSVVTYPAYPDTSVALRSLEQWRGNAAPPPVVLDLDWHRRDAEVRAAETE